MLCTYLTQPKVLSRWRPSAFQPYLRYVPSHLPGPDRYDKVRSIARQTTIQEHNESRIPCIVIQRGCDPPSHAYLTGPTSFKSDSDLEDAYMGLAT